MIHQPFKAHSKPIKLHAEGKEDITVWDKVVQHNQGIINVLHLSGLRHRVSRGSIQSVKKCQEVKSEDPESHPQKDLEGCVPLQKTWLNLALVFRWLPSESTSLGC